ncbi:30S ribosomal protein S8 [Candidatus Uhrbacteria bacterium RIFCSPHIGHO2_12_FULL_54_23]|uniref:Small ribosomal subunit protein uS8 n=3 Tax=Candidatus Uhriibacteriota TaxID=1752732 RepID=A0A1F7UZE3_9BACT|nr:MAG: 30S ribosomal protein S8 [Candidatus Uhrbacteria bacterium RIFCSPHIGHO2_12_FULL_54_23]OGL77969.1 MAG: 30S ribosomal protein S8 [Candidatus Uhrbacteria bacterium RIFCSPHIGHO2_12_FULL_54_23]OGL83620.1 MAG: 30S ribosomal protein S8 [Candidatus Uhrbacteria bacterium RIFCSPLOWO2_01_FULL_55_36]OGL83622.1 MAG: 30S ribosomal protein S8 [Candidatus Uhrbacteria bacterium RIFCSPLOWO2_01_FULL_55_36]OGL89993.1 MAG: 30S ribosomal protein S8 [Candidatus Uhrbacteria bacterium RIFCSPLOWO2_02_FULL_54_37]
MLTDPIADMLTRIRNAQMARKPEVVMPYSLLKHAVANVLAQEQFIARVEHVANNGARRRGRFVPDQLRMSLKYAEDGTPAITRVARVSTPGRRVYRAYRDIPSVQNNYGIAVISTPQGVMTNREARTRKVGGEVLCEVW